MAELFKGWRRKAGVVTLVMTCIVTAGWVRSHSLQDVVTFQSGTQAAEYLMSLDGNIVLERLQTPGPSKTDLTWFTNKLPPQFGSLHSPDVHSSWRWGAFGIGELPYDWVAGIRRTLLAIPYWSIDIPLTLLSAFLLLSKRRIASA